MIKFKYDSFVSSTLETKAIPSEISLGDVKVKLVGYRQGTPLYQQTPSRKGWGRTEHRMDLYTLEECINRFEELKNYLK